MQYWECPQAISSGVQTACGDHDRLRHTKGEHLSEVWTSPYTAYAYRVYRYAAFDLMAMSATEDLATRSRLRLKTGGVNQQWRNNI
jgi:hypothetical protein